jgi:hypothetical protein
MGRRRDWSPIDQSSTFRSFVRRCSKLPPRYFEHVTQLDFASVNFLFFFARRYSVHFASARGRKSLARPRFRGRGGANSLRLRLAYGTKPFTRRGKTLHALVHHPGTLSWRGGKAAGARAYRAGRRVTALESIFKEPFVRGERPRTTRSFLRYASLAEMRNDFSNYFWPPRWRMVCRRVSTTPCNIGTFRATYFYPCPLTRSVSEGVPRLRFGLVSWWPWNLVICSNVYTTGTIARRRVTGAQNLFLAIVTMRVRISTRALAATRRPGKSVRELHLLT